MRGPYHLHVGHRPKAGHVDVRFDFCHGTCGTRRRVGRGAERGRAPSRRLRAAEARELCSASRFSSPPLLPPPSTTPLCPGRDPPPARERPRCPGADALPHRPDGAGVSPSTSKSRPEPVVVAVQQLVEDASDVFRVEVPPVALAPQRLLDAAERGEFRRQRPVSAHPPDPRPSGRAGQERRPGDPSLAAPRCGDALGSGAMRSLTS